MPPVGFEPTISAGERPVAAHLLRSWVRIPPGAWIFVCCECRVLSVGGLCDELITRPEESYRLWCVVCDLETSRIGPPCIYDISCLRVNTNAHCSGRNMLRVKTKLFQCGIIKTMVILVKHEVSRSYYTGLLSSCAT